jgi:hypothetical protein
MGSIRENPGIGKKPVRWRIATPTNQSLLYGTGWRPRFEWYPPGI